jgi:hypothetical protein
MVTAPWWIKDQEQAVKVLESSNVFINHFFQLLSLTLNFCLCLDIVLTMGNPFSPHDRRMKFYLIASILTALVLSRLTLSNDIIDFITSSPLDVQSQRIANKAAFGVVFLSLYIIYATFSVAYAYRLNTRPGFSEGLRGAFIRNHMYYVLVYVLTWVPYIGLCFYVMYTWVPLVNLSEQQSAAAQGQIDAILESLTAWYYSTLVVSMCTGLAMAIVRMREPMFSRQLKVYWYQYWGELPPDTDKLTYQ